MTIEKVINNNIVSAFDETGREVVVMGRGIGLGNRPGAKDPEDKIERFSGSKAEAWQISLKSCLPEFHWSMQRSRVILFLMQRCIEAEAESEHLCDAYGSY